MAHYIVQATPRSELLDELRRRLDDGEIRALEPFGRALHFSLTNAKIGDDGRAIWEEVDYCRPPLAMERAAVLDDYFTDLRVEAVDEGAGWQQIEALPSLWPE